MEDRKFKQEQLKAAAVINSCRTNDQAIAAYQYVELAAKLWAFRRYDKGAIVTAEARLWRRFRIRQYQITAAECL